MSKLLAALIATLATGASACGAKAAPTPALRITYAIDLEAAVDELRVHPDDAVDPQRAAAARARALDAAVHTLQRRLRDVAGARVAADGDRIVVDLPRLGDDRRATVQDVIARTGALSLRVVDSDAAWTSRLAAQAQVDRDAIDAGINVEAEAWRLENGTAFGDHFLVAADREAQLSIDEAKRTGCYAPGLATASGQVTCRLSGRQVIERYVHEAGARDPSLRVPEDHLLAYGRLGDDPASRRAPSWRTYYLAREPHLTGSAIARADVTRAPDSGRPAVAVTFDTRGRDELARITADNVGRKLAVVVDDTVQMAPVVRSRITSGQVLLPLGDDREREARELAVVLRAGALPAPLREESVTELGPDAPAP